VLIEHDYPLYDGDELLFGGDRLHELQREWKTIETGMVERWREIADLLLKQAYLQMRVEAMAKALRKDKWDATQIAVFDKGLVKVVLKLGIADGFALRTMLEGNIFQNCSDLEVVCVAVLLIEKVAGGGGGGRVGNGEVAAVWGKLAKIGKFDLGCRGTMERLTEWMGGETSQEVECWEVACLAKRISRVLAGLEKYARENGNLGIAERFAAGRAAIVRSKGFQAPCENRSYHKKKKNGT
jgi:hypothetical protein